MRRPAAWAAPLLLLLLPRTCTAQSPAAMDQNRPCQTSQDFGENDFAIEDLLAGVSVNNSLCPQFWHWFRIDTRRMVDSTALQQAADPRQWVEKPVSEELPHAVSIALDAGYDYQAYRFTSLTMLVVNGTPPADPLRDDPYDDGNDYGETHHFYTEATDRETIAFGYNDSVAEYDSRGCMHTLAEYVFIALRCTHKLGGPRCYYNLTATPLPHELRHGMDFVAHIRPAWPAAGDGTSSRHFYRLSVAPYESLTVKLERWGDGRPLKDGYSESLGVGLAGGVYLGKGFCPTNSSEDLVESCGFELNVTEPCEVGFFCSTADDAGDYTVMVEASVGVDRPVTYIDQSTSPYQEGCEPGPLQAACRYVRNFVGPDGLRPAESIIPGNEGAFPRYNNPAKYQSAQQDWDTLLSTRNELVEDRGAYRLRVNQLVYAETTPLMTNDETRPGCVSYGQWRRFRLLMLGPHNSTLSLHVTASSGTGLGPIYVSADKMPTDTSYDAMVERSADGGAQRLTVSPCDLRKPTVWNVLVTLEDWSVASSRGIRHTAFELSAHLENATIAHVGGLVTPRGGDHVDSPALGAGGDGMVCCGVFKYFLVPSVPSHLSLRVVVNVSRGALRSVILKAASCPRYPEDVDGAVCRGKCTARWLTTYNPYDGEASSLTGAEVWVPNGLGPGCPASCPPDLRAPGDWYVGVQAVAGTEAWFTLRTSVVTPPPPDGVYRCDKWERPCPAGKWLAAQSSAPRGGRRRSATGAAAASALLGAALLLAARGAAAGGREPRDQQRCASGGSELTQL